MNKFFSAAIILGTALSLGACAGTAEDAAQASSASGSIVATERHVAASGVVTAAKYTSGDLRAVLWDAAETTPLAELSLDASTGDWTVVQLPAKTTLQAGHRTEGSTLAWANMMTLTSYAIANRTEADGLQAHDSPGCDMIGLASGMLVNDRCGTRARGCCNAHDNCYARYGCTAWSWLSSEGSCAVCNNSAMYCFATGSGQSNCRLGDCTCEGWNGSCFVADTAITMADGTTKGIDKVEVGDEVKSFDEASGEVVNHKVTKLYFHAESSDNLVVVNGITTTANHPFYANGHWVRADHLAVGDAIKTVGANGMALTTSITSLEGRGLPTVPVYNFEVEGTHTYFAGGILVHNFKAAADPCVNSMGLGGADPVRSDNGCGTATTLAVQ